MATTLTRRLALLVAVATVGLGFTASSAFATVPVNGPGGWQTGGFTVTVTDGYSYNNGASMSCGGSNGAYETYYGAGPNSGGVLMEQQWYVPNNGATTISCTVWNSTRTASDSGSNTFYMDNVTPSVGVNVYGGAGANGWYYSSPGFSAAIYGNGPSGISSTGCGGIYQQGANSITCSGTSGAGLTGYGNTTVYYDSYTPYTNTNISGGSGANGWYGSAPSITPGPYNVGPSGVWYDSCSGLSNGVNSVTCSVTDVNGLGSTDGATTVRLDNQTPSNTLPGSTGTWYSTTGAVPSLPVSATEGTNYSGLTSLSCSNSNNPSGTYSVSQGVSAGASLSGTYPVSDLANGTNNITCVSTTGAGNARSSSFTVLLDTVAPTVGISTTASASTWYPSVASIPAVSTSGTVGSSGVKTYTCSGDGITAQNYAAASGGAVSLTGLSNGGGTVTCTLTDNNGLSATSTQNLKLDTLTPTISVPAGSGSTWYSASTVPTLTVTGSESTNYSGITSLSCTDSNTTGANSGNYSIAQAPATAATLTGAYPAADLGSGTNTVTCATATGAGTSVVSSSFTVLYDASTPAVTVTPNTTAWQSGTGTINVSAAATGPSALASFTCSVDGGTATAATASGQQFSFTANGPHTVSCTATNQSGGTGSASGTVKVDSTTPDASFTTSESPTAWYTTDSTPQGNPTPLPTVTVSASDSYSGIDHITCNGDGLTGFTITGGTGTIPAADLNQGSGTVSCVATTGAGLNSADTATRVMQIDNTMPTLAYSTTESAAAWYPSSGSVPAVTLNAANSGPSGIDHIVCSGDGINGDTINAATGNLPTNQYAQGSGTVTCAAYSPSGVASANETLGVQVDTVVPAISYASAASQASWYDAASDVPAITANSNVGPSGATGIVCNGGGLPANYSGTNGTLSLPIADLNQGADAITCAASNGAGTTGPGKTFVVHVDSTLPTVSYSTTESQTAWYDTDADLPAITVNGSTTGGSGVAEVVCNGGGLPTNYTINGTSGTLPASDFPDGSNTVTCHAISGAAVTGADTARVVQVDGTAPTVALSGTDAGTWYSTAPTVTATGAEAPALSGVASTTCQIDSNTASTATGATQGVTVTGDGSHTVSCFSTTAAGVNSANATAQVHVDSQVPAVTLNVVPPPAGQAQGTVAVQVNATEGTNLSGIASLSCSSDGQTAVVNQQSTRTILFSAPGDHTLSCVATTGAGVTNTAATGTYTVQSGGALPPLDLVTGNLDTSWSSGSVQIPVSVASNQQGAYQSLTCVTQPSGIASTMAPTGGTITVTANGTSTVGCYATGNNGAETAAVSTIVRIDAQTPTATFAETPTSNGEKVAITGSEAQSLSGITTTSCAVDGGTALNANGASLNVQLVGPGAHTVACQITTGAGIVGNASQSFNTVINVPAPSVTNPPDPGRWYTTSTVTVPVNVPATATELDCTLGGQALAPITPTAGVAKVPVAAPGGTVTCKVKDQYGDTSNSVSFTVHIDVTPPAGYFEQAGPSVATAQATDSGSGVASVTIYDSLDNGATWTALPTSWAPSSNTATADLPASLTAPNVSYTLKAVATDNAGNSETITTLQNGQAASFTNPASGSATVMSVNASAYAGTVAPGAKVKTYVTKTIKSHGKVKKLRVVKWVVSHPSQGKTITVPYKSAATLTGTVDDGTGAAQAGQTVTIAAAPLGAAGHACQTKVIRKGHKSKRVKVCQTVPAPAPTTLGTTTTDANGQWSFRVPAGTSRLVTITAGGGTSTITLNVTGAATVKAPKAIVAGSTVKVGVTLAPVTRPVAVKVQVGKAGRWLTVATLTTTGHASAKVKLPASLGHGTVSWRAIVIAQPGWTYLATTSAASSSLVG